MVVCISKGDDIEKSSHRAHSSSIGEMIHRENGRRKKENSSESFVVILLAKEEDKLFTRENLKTHRNNFVDRFLRRIRLGDDLDASKLGSECKHDDVRGERQYL